MNRSTISFLFIITILLQSCEFNCSVGDKGDKPGTAVVRNGIRLTNDIEMQADGVTVEKAYLVFQDGTAVPEGNITDFSQSVRLTIVVEDGWKLDSNGRVSLGAYEKIEVETGEVLLEEEDLFAKNGDTTISEKDAGRISLSATIKLRKEIKPLTTFYVYFRVWDKIGKGFIQGRYKLFSK